MGHAIGNLCRARPQTIVITAFALLAPWGVTGGGRRYDQAQKTGKEHETKDVRIGGTYDGAPSSATGATGTGARSGLLTPEIAPAKDHRMDRPAALVPKGFSRPSLYLGEDGPAGGWKRLSATGNAWNMDFHLLCSIIRLYESALRQPDDSGRISIQHLHDSDGS